MPRAVIAPMLCLILLTATARALPVIDNVSIPSSADASKPIPVFVNVTSEDYAFEVIFCYQRPTDPLPSYESLYLSTGDHTNGTWYGEVEAQIWNGTLSCWVVAKDNTGETRHPSTGGFTVFLEGEKESTFPWNLVAIVGFVFVAFILTELAFKPGLYRKTGRQKARELEEEDRRREEESREESPTQGSPPPGPGSPT
jgi:hypothetical protein